MKSRIRPTLPKTLIGINIDAKKAEMISQICEKEDVVLKLADSSCGNESVGYLCGFKGFEKSDKGEKLVEDECLLFSMIDNKALNRILSKLRESGCGVNLKAVVTASNQSWTVEKLMGQLSAEHIQMNGGRDNG